MGRKDKVKRTQATNKKGGPKSKDVSKEKEIVEVDDNNEENDEGEDNIPKSEDTEEKEKKNNDEKKQAEEKSGKNEVHVEDMVPVSINGQKTFARLSAKEKAKYDAEHRLVTGVLHSQKYALDVKIGGFSLIFHGKELIKDTTLEFTIGRRYGLIGSNGSGKSQLLKCLAAREVPIPEHIDTYLLEEEAEPSELTPIEYVVAEAKREVERLEAEAEEVAQEDPDGDLITDLYNRLDELDPDTFAPRAGMLLHGLGFNQDLLGKKTKELSGGWRMRVALAKALFIKPSLLLLDEPTNHLDLEACVWLENYLANYNRCLVIISHSQDFLNNVCTHILHLTPIKTLQSYTGNYDQFIKTKAEVEVNQMKRYEKEQNDIAHIKQIIAKAGTYKNTVRQAKSREKVIEKMEARGLTEKIVKEYGFTFRFPACEKLPPPVMALEHVTFAYSGNLKDALYKDVNLGVDMDSRIAIVGQNGTGKSTLLKLMLGLLTPTEGQIKKHIHLNLAQYNQHSADILDPSLTTLEFIRQEFQDLNEQTKLWGEQEFRTQIGKYGISGPAQAIQIGKLSDGLRARIVFCMMALQKPHVILLDEPTNHLDMESIDGLAEAINNYDGGMVLVSHDFRLIDQVARTIWVVGDRNVKVWKGDIRSYKKSLVDKLKKEEMEQKAQAKANGYKEIKI